MVKNEKEKLMDKVIDDWTSKTKILKGLTGWLIIVQIGLILSIIIFIAESIFLFLRGFIGFALIFLLFFLYETFVIFLMYSKDKKFPLFAIIGIWAPFGILIILSILNTQWFFSSLTEILFSLIGGIIWTAYFRKSERVRNTFVKEKIKFTD